MNRGIYSDGQLLNFPNPIGTVAVDGELKLDRPPVATLAPIFTPPVTFVGMPQYAAGVLPSIAAATLPPLAPVTLAPAQTPATNALAWIVPGTLAAILLVWIVRVLFGGGHARK